jgi:p-methyltransferase
MSQGTDFPESRFFMREHVDIEGRRMACMDVINHYLGDSRGALPYYHVGEVTNLAAIYLTSYLRNRGYDVEFAGLFRPEKARLRDLLRACAPRVVAITTTFYLMPWPVREICDFVREHSPGSTVAIGGPLVDNLAADLSPRALSDTFEWIGGHLYVREAQGEATLAQIIGALRESGDLESVPNIYVRAGSGFRYTRPEPERNDLDECAIVWDRFSDEDLGATVQTRTARSCAFKCSFCDFPVRAGALSLASVETVEWELRQIAERNVRNVVFIDDTFNVPIGRFKELCKMMIRNGFGFDWFSFFRCSAARDDETYDLMQASGCKGVFLGIESGDEGVLKNMNKGGSLHHYRNGIAALRDRGIITFASLICGFPGETEQSVANTVSFINDTQPMFFRTELWWYNHRAPVHAQAPHLGVKGRGYEWEHATMNVRQACDAADVMFREISGPTWLPGYNYDFWSLPYLLGKGFSLDQITCFLKTVQELVTFNGKALTNGQVMERDRSLAKLRSLFKEVRPVPPRYRKPDE